MLGWSVWNSPLNHCQPARGSSSERTPTSDAMPGAGVCQVTTTEFGCPAAGSATCTISGAPDRVLESTAVHCPSSWSSCGWKSAPPARMESWQPESQKAMKGGLHSLVHSRGVEPPPAPQLPGGVPSALQHASLMAALAAAQSPPIGGGGGGGGAAAPLQSGWRPRVQTQPHVSGQMSLTRVPAATNSGACGPNGARLKSQLPVWLSPAAQSVPIFMNVPSGSSTQAWPRTPRPACAARKAVTAAVARRISI